MPDSVKLWHWWNAGENSIRPEAHWGLAIHGDYSVPDAFGNRYDYRFEQVVPDANHEFSVWMYNADDTDAALPRHGDPSIQTIDPGGCWLVIQSTTILTGGRLSRKCRKCS